MTKQPFPVHLSEGSALYRVIERQGQEGQPTVFIERWVIQEIRRRTRAHITTRRVLLEQREIFDTDWHGVQAPDEAPRMLFVLSSELPDGFYASVESVTEHTKECRL